MTAFDDVQARLREIILAYRADLAVTRDGPDGRALEVPVSKASRGGMSPARASARVTSATT